MTHNFIVSHYSLYVYDNLFTWVSWILKYSLTTYTLINIIFHPTWFTRCLWICQDTLIPFFINWDFLFLLDFLPFRLLILRLSVFFPRKKPLPPQNSRNLWPNSLTCRLIGPFLFPVKHTLPILEGNLQ